MEVKLFSSGKGAGPIQVTLGDLTIWFSYAEPIAYHHHLTGYVISHNEWGITTGRHLNAVHPHEPSERIPRAQFLAQLLEIVTSMTKPERAEREADPDDDPNPDTFTDGTGRAVRLDCGSMEGENALGG